MQKLLLLSGNVQPRNMALAASLSASEVWLAYEHHLGTLIGTP